MPHSISASNVISLLKSGYSISYKVRFNRSLLFVNMECILILITLVRKLPLDKFHLANLLREAEIKDINSVHV